MGDDLAEVNAFLGTSIPALASLGIEVVELEEGRAVSRLPFGLNANHFGAVYAGSLFCVGEMLAGAIMIPSFDFGTAYPLVKNMTINFLRPATSDVLATATLSIDTIRRLQTDVATTGKAVWQHEVELRDVDGVLVATMAGEGQIRAVAPR